ncbi:hypothetical protein PM082_022094 [Marasmius tenuissimus]|nr:hypothetical protein PM082_022094 [Marasmius tenuissimus]
MLNDLPVETALSVLAYLPIPSIHALQLVSKAIDQLVKTNESTIYRFAAVVHDFIPSSNVELDQLQLFGVPVDVLRGMELSWREFCRRMFRLEKNWEGLGSSELVCFPSAGAQPAYIKVDENEGFLINESNTTNGLVIVDMDDNVLWTQPWDFYQTRGIEYSSGYLSFNTPGWTEIWRLASIPDSYPPSPADSISLPRPNASQLRRSQMCFESHRETYPKGHFVPHTAFPSHPDDNIDHMEFPTLLVKRDDEKALFYDIPTRKLIQKVPLQSQAMQSPSGEVTMLPPLGRLWTLSFNERHIFMSSLDTGIVRVLERDTGKCILNMRNGDYGSRSFRCWEYSLNDPVKMEGVATRLKAIEIPPTEASVVPDYDPAQLTSKEVFFSSCGKHIVSCNSRWNSTNIHSNQLIVVRDFAEIPLGNNTQLAEHAIQIELETQVMAFSFDGNRRILVAKPNGVWVLDISPFLSTSSGIMAISIPAYTETRMSMPPISPRLGFTLNGSHRAFNGIIGIGRDSKAKVSFEEPLWQPVVSVASTSLFGISKYSP